jgi:hypothetical protein
MSTKLLSIDTNAKTVKGQKQGYLTGILYMAPSDISGVNLCPMAKLAQCEKACLYTAGRGAFNNVQQARIRKAQWFNTDRERFMRQLFDDIKILQRKALKLGLIPLVRLNGTTDIRFETIRFSLLGELSQFSIFEYFPNVQFYDYTKISNRKDLPANYDLTFSYSGVKAFKIHAYKALANGLRLAVVFDKALPETFLDLPVINGDSSDIRHLDPKRCIVGLKAKGKAKQDTSGFVVKFPVFTFKVEA